MPQGTGSLAAMVQTMVGDRLFITKVPSNATKDDVAAYFSQFGATTDVYLPMVPGTMMHKGTAFVSYADPASAKLVMSHTPHTLLGETMVVDLAAPRGAPPGGGKGGGGMFAAGLGGANAFAAAAEGLAAQAQAGADPAQAAVAMAMMQQMQQLAQAQEEPVRLFVTKVAPHITQSELHQHFSAFGELTDCYVPSAPGAMTHKGIAFVSFADPSALQLAMQHTPHEIAGSEVVIDVAAPKGPGTGKGKGKGKEGRPTAAEAFGGAALGGMAGGAVDATGVMGAMGGMGAMGAAGMAGGAVPGRCFVTRVPPDITKMDLQLFFQQYGDLTDVFVPSGGKGIGFVSFADPAAAQAVIEQREHEIKPGQVVAVEQAFDRPAGGGKSKGKGFAPY